MGPRDLLRAVSIACTMQVANTHEGIDALDGITIGRRVREDVTQKVDRLASRHDEFGES